MARHHIMQIVPRSLNLDAIYSQGFDAVVLTREHYAMLKSVLATTQWVADPEGMFSAIPDWQHKSVSNFSLKAEAEQASNREGLERAPAILQQAASDLLTSEALMGSWLLAFDFEVKFLSLWDGAEPLDWHWDGPANADFFFLIYLNETPGWQDQKGGRLLTGERSLTGNYLRTQDAPVKLKETIAPAQRTLVCCNNQNPRFVHKVEGLTAGDQRRVLMIGFDAIASLKGQRH